MTRQPIVLLVSATLIAATVVCAGNALVCLAGDGCVEITLAHAHQAHEHQPSHHHEHGHGSEPCDAPENQGCQDQLLVFDVSQPGGEAVLLQPGWCCTPVVMPIEVTTPGIVTRAAARTSLPPPGGWLRTVVIRT